MNHSQQIVQKVWNYSNPESFRGRAGDFAEQTRVVAEVERRLSVVDELQAVVSGNLKRASRLRQSILQRAFTGGLIHAND
jgi:hypothetical protein